MACPFLLTLGKVANFSVLYQNQAITSKTVNAKLFEGKMHTPGQCKTISNGLFDVFSERHPELVLRGDFQLQMAEKQEVKKCQIS